MDSPTLHAGQWLKPGQSIYSDNGRCEFKMQEDGKFAVYWNGECRWQNTVHTNWEVKGLHLQEDGNLCVYAKDDTILWQSNTARSNGHEAFLTAQDDGNVVLYAGKDQPVWASNTQWT
ncbi:bulb-type lectin domain-containing protein [Aspergillus transmontanensis]|uniref:Bulb-type lectin domain-containing protein n=1 Tax=Aspergillus transmontanensis TaxID=1034304 RepID=A0A5N6W3P1_9EURO|nr:bulb-type lectin domain-containing protein [Aspergillus transmontanensis]